MTNDEADDRYDFSEHRREQLVTLHRSKIIGRYNTPDTLINIGPRE